MKTFICLVAALFLCWSPISAQISVTKIGESSNIYTAIRSTDHQLATTKDGLVVFAHRQNVLLHGGQAIENGIYRYAISSDSANSWVTEQGPLNPQYSQVSRYPNVLLTTLPGNSHPSLVYAGPTLDPGFPVVNSWQGIVSGIIDDPVQSPTMVGTETYSLQNKTGLDWNPPTSFTCSKSGVFWMVSRESYVYSIFRGDYDSTDQEIDWTEVTSFNFTIPSGLPAATNPKISFDSAGQVGLMAFPGDLQNGEEGSFHILYSRTIDGGQSWSPLEELSLSIFPTLSTAVGGTPTLFGEMDLLVDQEGTAHFFSLVGRSNGNYNLFTRQNLGAMILADLSLSAAGKWEGRLIADVKTYRGSIIPNLNPQDNWVSMSESSDGILYYHWTDSDTLAPGFSVFSGNSAPDLYGRALDLSTKLYSPVKNWTDGIIGWDNHTSVLQPATRFNGDAFDHVPMVVPSLLNYTNALAPVDLYYFKGIKYDSLILSTTVFSVCDLSEFSFSEMVVPSACNTANGSLEVTISPSDRGPYTYQWDSGDSTSVLTDKEAGFYELTFTDNSGCQQTKQFFLPDSSNMTLSDSITPVGCNNLNTGSISVEVAGGVAPFWITWSNGESSLNNQGLSPGSYTLEVSDLLGCKASGTYVLETLAEFDVVASVTIPSCSDSLDGRIFLYPSGGVSPYTIQWDHGPTAASLTTLESGVYVANITDSNGCFIRREFDLTGPDPLDLTLTANPNSICSPPHNGFATVSYTGGTDPVQFEWTGSGGFTANQNIIFGLPGGIYTVTATDNNGCTATESITIHDTGNTINATVSFPTPTCTTPFPTVTTSITAGSGPFTYEWMDGSSSPSITNVQPGPVWVKISNTSSSCSFVYSDTIPSLSDIVVDASTIVVPVCHDSSGSIMIDVNAAGLSGDALAWSTGDTGSSISSLPPGVYILTVTKPGGCIYQVEYDLNAPSPLSISSFSNGALCDNLPQTTANVTLIGGTPPYQYQWPALGPGGSQSPLLGAGSYMFTGIDQNGCTVQQAFEIESFFPFDSVGITEIQCNEGTGAIIPILKDESYSWNWAGQSATLARHQLSAGSYQLIVDNGQACVFDTTFVLSEPSGLDSDAGFVIDPGDTTATLTAIASGGTPGYQFAWNYPVIGTDSIISVSSEGEYLLVVTDRQSCFDTTNIFVDGLFSVSVIEGLEKLSLQISPNPTSEILQVTWNGSAAPGAGEVSLWNIEGKKLEQITFPHGQNAVSFDLSPYPEGTYLVLWKVNQTSISRRIVKISGN